MTGEGDLLLALSAILCSLQGATDGIDSLWAPNLDFEHSSYFHEWRDDILYCQLSDRCYPSPFETRFLQCTLVYGTLLQGSVK